MNLFPDLPDIDELVCDPVAADYAMAARYALGQRQLPRAVEQIGAAIALEPQDVQHRSLLEQILLHSRDKRRLLTLRDEGTFYGVAAARVWFEWRGQKWNDGFEIACLVLGFRPNFPLLGWVRDLDDLSGLEQVDANVLARLIETLFSALERDGLEAGGRANLTFVMELAARVDEPMASEALLLARARVYRATGQSSSARELLDSSKLDTWGTHVAASWLHGDAGELSSQRAHLEEALRHRPDDVHTLLDLGLTLVCQGDIDTARELLNRDAVLRAGDEAACRGWYLRALDGDNDARRNLSHADSSDAAVLLRDLEAFETVLPDPMDPLVLPIRDVLRRAAMNSAPEIRAQIAISTPLAPSAELALESGRSHSPNANLEFRAPSRARSVEASNCSDDLHDKARAAMGALIHEPFSWDGWRQAAQLQMDWEPEGLREALARPVGCPPDADSVQWFAHLHCAAGFLLGTHESAEPMIAQLLALHEDWVCIAGLVALAVRGFEDESATTRALETTRAFLRHGVSPGRRAAAILGMRLSSTDDAEFQRARVQAVFELLR